jgi:hypothetical protein
MVPVMKPVSVPVTAFAVSEPLVPVNVTTMLTPHIRRQT